MSARASGIVFALAATLLVPALAAADQQAYRFTYPDPCFACALGPGAARGINIIVNGIDVSTTRNAPERGGSEIVEVTLLAQNAPGCGEPKIDHEGNFATCAWDSECLFPAESVDLCIRTSGPIFSVTANFVDIFDNVLVAANVEAIAGCGELDCDQAVALVPYVWPPNHKLLPVVIEGVTGGTGAITIEATAITQDEPLDARGNGDGETCTDGQITGGNAFVRSERAGTGNGRVYVVSFTATDEAGATCDGEVTVCVAHDPDHACVDDGQDYDSLDACEDGLAAPAFEAAGLAATLRLETAGNLARIAFDLPVSARVDVGVFDVAGRRVASVEQGMRSAGPQQVSWDVSGLARGLYFVRVRAGAGSASKTLLID